MFIPSTTIATNWFDRKRPLALSLLISSGGVGGLTVPPLISWLISNVGWRITWLYLAMIPLVLAVVVAGIIIRNKPEDVGQQVDGAIDQNPEDHSAVIRNENHQASPEWKASDALRTPTLWLMIGFTASFEFAWQMMIAHQVAYLRDLGYSPIIAAATLGLLPGISTAGRFSYGFLTRKLKRERIIAICLGSMLVAIVIFMNAISLSLIYFYTLLFGLSFGMLLVAYTDLLAKYYGRIIYPQLLGWIYVLWHVFSTPAPWIAGLIYDSTGNYTPAFIIAVSFLAFGLICASLLRPPKPRESSIRDENLTKS